MTRQISAELLKLRSTRTAIALIASVVGLVVLIGLIATLTVAPDRVRLVMAKLVAHVLAGLLLGILAVGLTTAIVLVVLSSRGIDSGLTNGEIAKIVIGLVLATALWAALGVGLGALVRNQVGAIVGALGWALLVENLLTIIPTVGDWVQKYGLNGVTNALSNIESQTTGDVLSQAAGGALLLLYTAVFVIAGTLAMRRRDVTS